MAKESSSLERRTRATDLHGNAPDNSEVALVLVDVINDLEFETGSRLLRHALPAARALKALKERATRAQVPCIYVNDNFGRWRSDFNAQVRHCLQDDTRGAALVKLLLPKPDDYFVLKPKHSAFYQTCLSVLLEHLNVNTLVIGGFTTDSCVTFTAIDAYLRNYALVLPSDGLAAADAKSHRAALAHMKSTLHARTPKCAQLGFVRGKHGARLRVKRG